MSKSPLFRWLLVMALVFAMGFQARAQWQTETFVVKPGWNAFYLNVDPSYQSIDDLVGADNHNPISQIWLWQPPATTLQFITSPVVPSNPNSQWVTWGRIGTGIQDTLFNLVPNSAYLVYSIAQTNFTWNVKGRPVPPIYNWTSTGLNFFGFSTPGTNSPNFEPFLALSPPLASSAQIYQYNGGELSSFNPSQLFAFRTTPVTRGKAFWIRAGTLANDYFGPFQAVLSSPDGISYGDAISQVGLTLRNVTGSNVTVSIRLLASEPAPAGQTNITGTPPILLRGDLDTATLTYGYTNLAVGSVQTFVLKPKGTVGSEVNMVLGLNRYVMTGAPGSLYAGIIQFTDAFGFSEIDLPVSAKTASNSGLWVGKAIVSQVGSYLKSYVRDATNGVVMDTNGISYLVASVNTNLGPVAQAYPLRLIVHNSGTNVTLLQRVYYGLRYGTNIVIATRESFLDATNLSTARRITSTQLPYNELNTPWNFTGLLTQGSSLTTTAITSYDDQRSNPFLHTYHPDHDNLDASFKTQLAQGAESYGISRQITLNINPPGNDFGSLTMVNQQISGIYQESITLSGLGGAPRKFSVTGYFSLNRISPIAVLTQQ